MTTAARHLRWTSTASSRRPAGGYDRTGLGNAVVAEPASLHEAVPGILAEEVFIAARRHTGLPGSARVRAEGAR